MDLSTASVYLDYLNLMGYDFAGPWTELSGHQAQLYTPPPPHANAFAKRSGHAAISYVVGKGFPARKILLGVPAYGRSFLGVDGLGQPFTGHAGEQGIFEFKDLPRPGTIEQIDEALGAAYCVGGDAGFVSYDNPDTVAMKAKYARDTGLGGLFYWTGVGDGVEERSLVRRGFEVLKGAN